MSFHIERTMSIGTLINVGALLIACVAAYFSFKESIADAGEAATRAEKLSTGNVEHISELKDIVSDLAKSIAVQNSTVTHTNELLTLKSQHLEQRLDALKERIDRERRP